MYNIPTPQNYFIGTSETSNISQDSVSQNGFSNKCNLKMGRVVIRIIIPNKSSNDPVPEGDLKKSNSEVCWDTDSFFSFRISSQQVSSLIIPCLVVATLFLFKPMSSNTLMPPLTSPSPSVNFNSITVLSLCSGSSSITTSASSRALRFRIWKNGCTWHSDHGSLATTEHLQQTYIQICALELRIWSGGKCAE